MIKSTKHIQSSLSYFLIKKEKISLATFRHLYLDKVRRLFKTQKMLMLPYRRLNEMTRRFQSLRPRYTVFGQRGTEHIQCCSVITLWLLIK